MNTTKYFKTVNGKSVLVLGALAIAMSAGGANAQFFPPGMGGMQQPGLACATPRGLFPLPPVGPQPGMPCGNGYDDHGVVVIVPPGGAPGQPPGFTFPPFPNGPFPPVPMPRPQIGNPYPANPTGVAYGRVARAAGVNREGQVAAECVGTFGVSKAGAACLAARLTVDEINKCFSDGFGGRGCFGDNNTAVAMLRGNIEAARRESGAANQVIRATTGISVGDIQKHGILGGQNSEARKICNALFGSC